MTTSTLTHTIVGVYPDRGRAEAAVQDLVDEGFSRDNISVVAPGSVSGRGAADVPNIGPIDEIGAGVTAGTGAAVGGLAGFVAGVAALAIPGIGPVLAAGPLAAGIMGAGIGAAAGAVAGALKQHGVPETHARRYSEAVGRGSCLVMVHATAEHVDHAADVLDRNGAIDVDEPAEHIGGGTETHIPRLTPDALEAAKLREGEGVRDRQRANERGVGIYPGITGGRPTPHS